MFLGATVDYSSVTAGALKFQIRARAGVMQALEELALLATTKATMHLLESYKTKPGRPDFARTGDLERAVFTAVSLGMGFPGGLISGTGNMDQLYTMAPYWDMVEEGSEEYMNQEISGFWVDASGQHYPPSARHPMDKFIPGPAYNMKIGTPIEAHNFYKDASEDMRKVFMPIMRKYALRGPK